jgi:hypothetical protein
MRLSPNPVLRKNPNLSDHLSLFPINGGKIEELFAGTPTGREFFSVGGALEVSALATAQVSASESAQLLCKLERSYWHYVQDNILKHYANLWHKDFGGLALCQSRSGSQRSQNRLDHCANRQGLIS